MSHPSQHLNRNAPDLPPVTDEHRQRAHQLLAVPMNFTEAMADEWRAKVIECCAASLRLEDWKRTQQRTVQYERRCRPGVDGHPVKWATQKVMGPYTPKIQPDLIETND